MEPELWECFLLPFARDLDKRSVNNKCRTLRHYIGRFPLPSAAMFMATFIQQHISLVSCYSSLQVTYVLP
jgi:hypothetical protein